MSTTAKRLGIGQITDTTLSSIYTATTGINTRFSKLSITNTGSTGALVSIYHNANGTDYLLKKLTLPGGAGIERTYYDIQRSIANAGDSIRLQSDTAITFNYFLHGSEIEVSGS